MSATQEGSDPALSILMPAYNAGCYLPDAVASAVSQFAAHDELVIQDACSTDGSMATIAETYANDPRVKIVSEKDGGQSEALQRALARAINPYVGWLNADDLYYPGALAAVRQSITDQPGLDVVYGSATTFAADGRIIRTVVPAEFTVSAFVEHGCHAFSGSTFFRAELLREAGGFDAELHYSMDFDLFLRVAARATSYRQLAETLGGLRWHDASKSGTSSMPFFKEAIKIRLSYATSAAQRRHVYAQMALRLAAVPLIPLRRSAAVSRLRRDRRF